MESKVNRGFKTHLENCFVSKHPVLKHDNPGASLQS